MQNSTQSRQQKNTIVRPCTQRVVFQTIDLISKVNPMLGADLSLRLFTTPLLKKSKTELFPPETTSSQVAIAGKKITLHRYGQGPRKILLIHGWEGAASDFYKFFTALDKSEFQVVAVDLPGHGVSPRASLDAAKAAEIIMYLELIHGPFSGIIGHSFGGFSSALAISNYSELRNIPFVSIGAPNKLTNILHSFSRIVGLSDLQESYVLSRIEKRFNISAHSFQFSHFIKYHGGPTLIVHDQNDKQVPVSTVDEIKAQNPDSQYLLTQNLGHNRILRNDKTIQTIVKFLQKHRDSRQEFENALKYNLISD